ncbi:MAG: hypothetical protein ACYDG4_10705 [Desulfuromonadaceae bacterium]
MKKNGSLGDILIQLDQPAAEYELEYKKIKIKTKKAVVRRRYGGRLPNKFLSDADWLKEAYETLNVKQLAAKLSVIPESVLYWLKKHQIPRKEVVRRTRKSKAKEDK